MKKPLRSFVGRLTPKQVADGMNAASRNARRLYEEAQIMAKAEHYPTGCALAVLAIEEAGKLSILRAIATAQTDAEVKSAWRDYRSHQAKNAAWIIVELAMGGARTLDDMKPMFDRTSDHSALLDAIKQIALYSDCLASAHWSEPTAVISKSLCESIILSAKVLLPAGETTEKEIELWVQHMTNNSTKDGLKAYQLALREAGFSRHTDEELERFLEMKITH